MTEPKTTLITRKRPNISIHEGTPNDLETKLEKVGYKLVSSTPLVLGLNFAEHLWAYGAIEEAPSGKVRTHIWECRVEPASMGDRRYGLVIEARRQITPKNGEEDTRHRVAIRALTEGEAVMVMYGQVITVWKSEIHIWAPPDADIDEENPRPKEDDEEATMTNSSEEASADGRGIRPSRFSARVRAGVFVDGGDHDERSSGGDGCCDDCDGCDDCCDCDGEAYHEVAAAEADARQNGNPDTASAEPEADVAPAGASAENVGGDVGESDSDTSFVPMGVLPFSGDLFVPMTIPHDDRRDPPEDDEDPADDEDSEDK